MKLCRVAAPPVFADESSSLKVKQRQHGEIEAGIRRCQVIFMTTGP